jgi:CRISPR/Cas system CSM-associated protein Csm3 (group 7 of RAMP superfamily)
MKEYKRYTVEVETQEPFRIGANKDVMDVEDNPIARVGERPVIQGPSLKGAFRAAVEEFLISTYPDKEHMRPCIPSSPNALSDDERQLIKQGKYRDGGTCHYSSKANSKSICPACYLFGAMGLPGFVRVPYLFTGTAIEKLYSVRVDRALRTVAEKTNRDYQIMPDKTKFIGDLEILIEDTANGWKLGEKRPIGDKRPDFLGDAWLEGWNADKILERLIIERLKSINILGGFKSKGCGKVEVNILDTK